MSSKLQIRAKIIELINKLDINALNKKEQESLFVELKNFEDKEFLQQILLKELNSDDEEKIEKIAYLITELANPEGVKEPLWDYIKDTTIDDKVKEMACTLLRIFGEKIRPEDLVNYLQNPMELIDAETKKLLDVALINPEVQIDFLDFLFALPKDERINLVKSLETDYQGDRLVNILAPILDSSDDIEIKEFIIKVLGNTKTQSAVLALKNVVEFSKDTGLVKLADIGLKKLRLAGISGSDSKIEAMVCENSSPYQSYISPVDGMGNQGIIFSRFSEDENVQMFSVVVNDIAGIVDCFGFYLLSRDEFSRIVASYSKDSVNVKIPSSFAKKCLVDAERLSRINQNPLPYEYLAWKSLFFDIEDFSYDFEQKAKEYSEGLKSVNYSLLVDSDVFAQWFFDSEDDERVDKFFDELLVADFIVSKELDEKISKIVEAVFDSKTREIYYKRLLNTMYLLDLREEVVLRDNIALLALLLKDIQNPLDCELFTWIMRKSVYELFLREQASFDINLTIESNIFAKPIQKYESVFSPEKLDMIISDLKVSWVG